MQEHQQAAAAAIAAAMESIRADVGAGLGANIEADAVAIMIGEELIRHYAEHDPAFDRDAFRAAADIADPIPSEAFAA